MARATLSYTLPEEEPEFRAALQGGKALTVLWNLDQHLRNRIKHGDLPATVCNALQHTRDTLHQLLAEHGVSLDE